MENRVVWIFLILKIVIYKNIIISVETKMIFWYEFIKQISKPHNNYVYLKNCCQKFCTY